jgi:hypothetical protein
LCKTDQRRFYIFVFHAIRIIDARIGGIGGDALADICRRMLRTEDNRGGELPSLYR